MYNFVLTIHIIVCILLVIIVLFQAGKKFGLSGLMGGGSSDAIVTGAGGNVIIKKITAILAVLFIITSLSLTLLTNQNINKSLMNDILPPVPVIPETTLPQQTQAQTQTNKVEATTKPAEEAVTPISSAQKKAVKKTEEKPKSNTATAVPQAKETTAAVLQTQTEPTATAEKAVAPIEPAPTQNNPLVAATETKPETTLTQTTSAQPTNTNENTIATPQKTVMSTTSSQAE